MYKKIDLPYLFQDLEPFIDIHTLGLHYHKHYQNYLNKLNELLIKNNYNYRYKLEELIYHINEFNIQDRENILFNLGGVINHNIYFLSICSKNIEMPIGSLLEYIERKYGSYDGFIDKFKNKALELKGSGYTYLVIKKNMELDIINLSNQDLPMSLGYIPLFNIDMWEHAYYINYENDKSKYIDNFMMIADFSNANKIFNSIFND